MHFSSRHTYHDDYYNYCYHNNRNQYFHDDYEAHDDYDIYNDDYEAYDDDYYVHDNDHKPGSLKEALFAVDRETQYHRFLGNHTLRIL